ncbi:CoxG family protein [Evansella sp. AB-rgal1]|uniref:CoxG family protein n=1 Tax=Evansella sp. AB-rgal1 TaxID=3242696 RepID=UPI00359E535A
MPKGIHTIELNVPIEKVWHFVSDMDRWAPLVPGYIEHKKLNGKQSTWKFESDIGIMKKLIHMKIDIKEWTKPSQVRFDLTGINEKFSGEGYFQAEKLSETKTKMVGCLDITAKGMMAPMVNPALKTIVPKTTKELSEAIAAKIGGNDTLTSND